MGTPTANYALSKPTIGGDSTSWGAQIDAAFDTIDSALFGKLDKAGGTMTGAVTLRAGSTGAGSAPAYFQAGSLLTAPAAHALEWDGTHGYLTQSTGPTRKQLAYIDDAITGSAAKLTTSRSIAMSGDVVWTVNFDGSGNVTAAGTIQAAAVTTSKIANSAVTNALMANMNAHTWKMNNTGSAAAPVDATTAQALTELGFDISSVASGSITLPGGVIVKWGNAGAIGGTSSTTVTFGTAFPTALGTVITTLSMPLGAFNSAVTAESRTGFTYYNHTSTASTNSYWLAIGS